MSVETEYLLVQWGAWQRSRPAGGCDSPMLIVMQLAQPAGMRGYHITDGDALTVDRAVAKLKMRDIGLYELIYLRYVREFSVSQIVAASRVNRQVIDRRLAGAVGWIDAAINLITINSENSACKFR